MFTSALPDVHLELEELDFDSLQDLGGDPLPAAEPVPEPALEPDPAVPFSEEEDIVTLSGLEALDTLPTEFLMPPPGSAPEPVLEPAAEPDDFLAHLPAAASLMEVAGAAVVAERATYELVPDIHESVDTPEPVPSLEYVAPAAGGQIHAVPGQAAPVSSEQAPVSSEQARALLQALLADPVLVDALVKAVVARMGDQVLREIAWEVMPDLAGRLQR